ncbi:MAG TPA: 3'(2'),5'-bisphosphate nucleotidase CysQ [Caulobacteraceae bacterium]|nr:3'(2'),5'-bisphosphate nucleotidase CysQ [Caulobacteraceae bacterium]
MNEDLALIREAATAAGRLAKGLREQGLKTEWKANNSPVTNGDLAVDAMLKERLLAARPDYGWLSEESADNAERLSRQRVFNVDPIDGTFAYIKDKAWYAVCIAVIDGDRPSAGVVYLPELDELYAAAAGEGATLNGQAIRPSNPPDLEGSTMLGDRKMFAHPAWPRPWPPMQIESRNSIAYRMCLVASGAFDACLAPSPKHDWDVAAPDLICTEAGALVTDHKGRSFRYNQPIPRQRALVCAGPRLHPLLLERVSHMQDD